MLRANNPWTDSKVTELKGYLAQGLDCPSYAVLAKFIFPDGRVTRSAIAGKVKRLGIGHGKPRGQKNYPSTRKTAYGMSPRHAARAPLPVITAPDPQFQCTLPQLGSMPGILQCRAPIGEPRTDEFRYCGSPDATLPGPYCPYHQKQFHLPYRKRSNSPILFVDKSRSVRVHCYD